MTNTASPTATPLMNLRESMRTPFVGAILRMVSN